MRHGRVRNGLEARTEGKAGAGRRRVWLGLEHNPAASYLLGATTSAKDVARRLDCFAAVNLNQYVALVDHCLLEGLSHCVTDKRVQGRMRWQRQAVFFQFWKSALTSYPHTHNYLCWCWYAR